MCHELWCQTPRFYKCGFFSQLNFIKLVTVIWLCWRIQLDVISTTVEANMLMIWYSNNVLRVEKYSRQNSLKIKNHNKVLKWKITRMWWLLMNWNYSFRLHLTAKCKIIKGSEIKSLKLHQIINDVRRQQTNNLFRCYNKWSPLQVHVLRKLKVSSQASG